MVKKMLMAGLVLIASYTQAATLTEDLKRLNTETLSTEFLALNCIKIAQKDKLITADCRTAIIAVQRIDSELEVLIDYLTQDIVALGPEFYDAMGKIKQFRSRLIKINDNLDRAKKVTGIYNWTDKIAPSYYENHL